MAFSSVFVARALGLLLGSTFSLNINWIADRIFEFTGFRVFPRDVYYLDEIPTSLNLWNMVGITGMTLFCSLLACTIPALKAARMDTVKALTSEYYLSGGFRSIFTHMIPALWAGIFHRNGRYNEKNTDSGRVKDKFFGAANLVYEYEMGSQKLRVLNDVNFDVKRGQIHVILGTSGAGKSTLLHILGLLDTPIEGSVYHEGINLRSLSLNRICRKRNENIGFVFQFYHLLPEFTALENVLMGAMVHKNWFKERQSNVARAKELLSQVGLEQRMRHRPLQLSGGERQRVAIARALINEPEIVLCDEPTGNLDAENSKSIQNLIWKLNKQMQQTFVIVTHDINIARNAHRVYKLTNGKLHEVHPEAISEAEISK